MDESHNEIMQLRIAEFNKLLMNLDISQMPIGLFDGLMGICIYFYYQGHYYREQKYYQFADKLLDTIANNLSEKMQIDIQTGLLGICFGINHLIKNNFVKGNNRVLQMPEEKIYREIYLILDKTGNLSSEEMHTLLHGAFYFCAKLKESKILLDDYFLCQNLIIDCINKIEFIPDIKKHTEPFLFLPAMDFLPLYLTLLSNVYSLKIYDYKLKKICDNLNDTIMSKYPYSLSNRLFLAFAIKEINDYYNNSDWKRHAEVLFYNISINNVIDTSFRNKNILPHNGLAGFYYILKKFGYLTDAYKNCLSCKLAQSELWEDKLNKSIDNDSVSWGLVRGLSGVILAYQDCANIAMK